MDLGKPAHLSGLLFNGGKSLALKSEDKRVGDKSSAIIPAQNPTAVVSAVKLVNDLHPTGQASR